MLSKELTYTNFTNMEANRFMVVSIFVVLVSPMLILASPVKPKENVKPDMHEQFVEYEKTKGEQYTRDIAHLRNEISLLKLEMAHKNTGLPM